MGHYPNRKLAVVAAAEWHRPGMKNILVDVANNSLISEHFAAAAAAAVARVLALMEIDEDSRK